ncbi:MAG: DUF58 domain-containing protein [Planctomycetes bacterium]|nr:DUF58 domain-containing protein [Planctomycetota bacterium]
MTPNVQHSAIDYLHPQTLSAVEGIELRARHIVEGLMTGMHRSPYFGYSVEFAQHRPYTPGDDLRHLDWKVFGRTDKLYLKQYQQETNLDLMLLVDASGSMRYGTKMGRRNQQWRKFDHATSIAAALSYLALQQQDRTGLIVFADKLLEVVRPSNARGQWRTIVKALSGQPVEAQTQMSHVFEQVISKLTHRTLVVILSDFFDDAAHVGAGLARLHYRRHDVMMLQTLDHAELTFPFATPQRLLGLENEGKLDLDPKALREAYLDELHQHIRALREEARRYRYDHELIDTTQDVGPPLSHFLARRAARLKRP